MYYLRYLSTYIILINSLTVKKGWKNHTLQLEPVSAYKIRMPAETPFTILFYAAKADMKVRALGNIRSPQSYSALNISCQRSRVLRKRERTLRVAFRAGKADFSGMLA